MYRIKKFSSLGLWDLNDLVLAYSADYKISLVLHLSFCSMFCNIPLPPPSPMVSDSLFLITQTWDGLSLTSPSRRPQTWVSGTVSHPEHNRPCCFCCSSDPPSVITTSLSQPMAGWQATWRGWRRAILVGTILNHHLQVTSQVTADVWPSPVESAWPRPGDSREIINSGGFRLLQC